MAQIVWAPGIPGMFSPEELECAVAGGSWDRETQTCTIAQPLPPSPPLGPVVPPGGGPANEADPYVCTFEMGWAPQSFALADGLTIIPTAPDGTCVPGGQTGRPPGLASPLPVIPGPGWSPFPGIVVPPAPPVALPSFVDGRLGEIRDPGGMRPVSGGRPERVHMGPTDIPVVRMKQRWDLRS